MLKRLSLILTALIFAINVSAEASSADSVPTEGKLNVTELIMGHVGDSYQWHITTIGEHDISLPLPVIVRSKTTGKWHIFSSSRFGHGEAEYRGFSIAHSGDYKGKIVEKSADGSEVRPLDMSITKNAFSLMLNSLILVLIILGCAKWYKNRHTAESNPRGFVAAMEMFIMGIVDDVIKPNVGENYRKFTPYLLTVFFFVFINNVIGLIPLFPGGANITGNIAITFVLATFTFLMVNIFGTKEYWREILWPNVPWWLKFPIPLMPAIEIIGMFTKPFALMIRLFANILAGHSMVIGMTAVIFLTVGLGAAMNGFMTVMSVVMTIFINCLELLVAYIQAYVFTILSSVFIGLAQAKAHD